MEDDLALPPPVWVFGLPITPLTRREAGEAIVRLIRARRPTYFITANLNYAMLTEQHSDLVRINEQAAFITADGMPLVRAAGKAGSRIPERVAGSDLIYDMAEIAAREGFRLFLLGAPPGVAQTAADNLVARFPAVQIAGVACPPYGAWTPEQVEALNAQIRTSRPDLVLVAFGQPKGERWIASNLEQIQVPLCVNLGASLDFVAGRISRAPRWIQKSGLEWLFRLALEPKRLFTRYFSNGLFYLRMLARGPRHWKRPSISAPFAVPEVSGVQAQAVEFVPRGDRHP